MAKDWFKFFDKTIQAIHKPLSVVLNASGCREGWLQGELYRAGQHEGLCVNAYRLGGSKTADIHCGDRPGMVGEIKIVGAYDAPKMRRHIESDVERIRAIAARSVQRYMILIIPNRDAKTKLGTYLHSCTFSRKCIDRQFPEFRLRIWRL